jgi:hypothetical protein
MRTLLDDGHSLASAEVIVGLQDRLADALANARRLQTDIDRLQGGTGDPTGGPERP